MAKHAIQTPLAVVQGKKVMLEVIWLSSPVLELELELPDHDCTPDCKHWKKKNKNQAKEGT